MAPTLNFLCIFHSCRVPAAARGYRACESRRSPDSSDAMLRNGAPFGLNPENQLLLRVRQTVQRC